MTLSSTLLGLWALLLVSRGTPLGDALHRWLVARPAAALARLDRGAVFGGAALAMAALACWWLIGQEGLAMFSMGLPELTGALAMIDLGVLVDVAAVVIAGAASGGWRALRMALVPRGARPRATRARRNRPQRKPAANDDDRPAFVRAA